MDGFCKLLIKSSLLLVSQVVVRLQHVSLGFDDTNVLYEQKQVLKSENAAENQILNDQYQT